ncbi:2'-5' RNA ligase family protein [Parvularcula dongshanensis]|uniref:2'-5' RNA ligase n=1 Tax=Parvularcula dongshanensis TaxID=1173995 RepID=A0A840I3T8_9PROT|nr:2'-5' RNA ligase family protein [Parvularcula dongshanensis]MBB4658995.1 2'-5' RNA ligase [Parvularcula dongshanensis]
MASPIILTLQLDAKSQDFFQDERKRWFVPRLDQVPAHLTLFHKLPGEEREAVMEALGEACAAREPFEVVVAEVLSLGAGVAYRLRSEALERLRQDLAHAFFPWLTGQDRQGFRAHVTVQNKVTKATAEACRAVIEAEFEPFTATAEGVQLWSYEGGPWGTIGAVSFGH